MKHVVKMRMYIVHAADSTEMVFLENVLGFVRVIQVVLDHIKVKLPEQLVCSSWPLDWPKFDVDTAPSDVEGMFLCTDHTKLQPGMKWPGW